jgi:hypothetical protein
LQSVITAAAGNAGAGLVLRKKKPVCLPVSAHGEREIDFFFNGVGYGSLLLK